MPLSGKEEEGVLLWFIRGRFYVTQKEAVKGFLLY
jgi:hypothetical protein